MTPYQVWRRHLHELQVKIQEYDENLDNYGENFVNYKINRKPLLDELEAHYDKEGDAIEETENQNP